jgi:predicted phosphate transport protein (TIGR00153 family)
MVRFNLIPRDARYFDLFERAGSNLVEMTHVLRDLLTDYTDVAAKLARLHELEHAGDACTREVMQALNRTFIAPLDREDIASLIRTLDDVADKTWAAAARLDIYRIPAPSETAQDLAGVLVQMVERLTQALPYLRRSSDMQRILSITEEIDRLETEADDLLRSGLATLFTSPADLEQVVLGVKWREIYDFLEGATDSAEDVADALEAIVLKHG